MPTQDPEKPERNVGNSKSMPPTPRPNFRQIFEPYTSRPAQTLPLMSGTTGYRVVYPDPQGLRYVYPIPIAGPPMNRFPFEIFMEIFKFCLPKETFITPDHRTAPRLLCLVCRHWRRIAMSIPTLWSSLFVQAGYADTPSLSSLKIWLSRTGKMPLSLAIAQTTRPDEEQYDYTESVLRLFVPLLPRWKTVQFRFESRIPQHTLLDSLQLTVVNAPLLESLSLEIHKWADDDLCELFTKLFQSSPKLRRFTWNREPFQSTFRGILWQQLTHVDITHWLTPADCLEILDKCDNVEELSLNGIVRRSSQMPEIRKVLPRLRSFTLWSQLDMSPLLNHLTLPALREFEIRSNMARRRGELLGWDSMRRLLVRSSCDLEKFAVYDQRLLEREIQDLMSLPFPSSLKELSIKVSFYVGEEMLKRFINADRYPDLRVVVQRY